MPYNTLMPEAKKKSARRSGVTLREIAEKVGVSVSTVSRVLNVDVTLSVGDGTRQAIIETAELLKYEPVRKRRHLRPDVDQSRIALLHFLSPQQELADPYYVSLRLGIESRCAALRLKMTKLYQTDRFPEAAVLENLAGLILIGRHGDDEISWIRDHNANLVFASHKPGGDTADAIDSDVMLATTKLLDALQALDYRRIAFAGWYDTPDNADPLPERRCVAYEQWMTARDLFEPGLLAVGSNTEESGYALTRSLLSRAARPDVIVTANDTMAVGAYRAIHQSGLSIPGDVGVASFNDISAARFMTPPLTTVRLPAEKIGEGAVDLLVERMNARSLAKQVVLESRIVWRESTRCPLDDSRKGEVNV